MERMCSQGYHSSKHLIQGMMVMLLVGLIVGIGVGIGLAS